MVHLLLVLLRDEMMVALSTTGCCTPNSWLNSISRRCNNDKAPFCRFGRLSNNESRIRHSNCWRWARPSLPSGHGGSSAEKCDVSDSGNAQDNTAIISACFVGLCTGISVVLFNFAVRHSHRFSISLVMFII